MGEVSTDRQMLLKVTRKVLAYSKHTLMSLYGHNILVKNKTNTNESTAVVPYGWRRKASKEWFIFLILKDVPKNGYCEYHSSGMNKNVFLQVIR